MAPSRPCVTTGTILGPWSAWLHDPKLSTAIWSVTKGMMRFRHLLEVSWQIVILVVGTRFRAAYEIYVRAAVARGVGVTEDQIATITAGSDQRTSPKAQVANDVAAGLLNGGSLPKRPINGRSASLIISCY
jgi:4-carboxymuconolactone decarboxylase